MKHALLFFSLLALIAWLPGTRLLYAEGGAVPAAAQEHDHGQQGGDGQAAAPTAGGTQHAAMGAHWVMMMQSRLAADAELTRLLQTMNAATGADKTTAMAALLTRLVQDRVATHGMMRGSTLPSTPQCPMMDKDSSGTQHEH